MVPLTAVPGTGARWTGVRGRPLPTVSPPVNIQPPNRRSASPASSALRAEPGAYSNSAVTVWRRSKTRPPVLGGQIQPVLRDGCALQTRSTERHTVVDRFGQRVFHARRQAAAEPSTHGHLTGVSPGASIGCQIHEARRTARARTRGTGRKGIGERLPQQPTTVGACVRRHQDQRPWQVVLQRHPPNFREPGAELRIDRVRVRGDAAPGRESAGQRQRRDGASFDVDCGRQGWLVGQQRRQRPIERRVEVEPVAPAHDERGCVPVVARPDRGAAGNPTDRRARAPSRTAGR